MNKEFVEFLANIREFVTNKEGQLKEYQVDLCQRERSLQNSEEFFKVKQENFNSVSLRPRAGNIVVCFVGAHIDIKFTFYVTTASYIACYCMLCRSACQH